jgi:hypothetical protein
MGFHPGFVQKKHLALNSPHSIWRKYIEAGHLIALVLVVHCMVDLPEESQLSFKTASPKKDTECGAQSCLTL